MNVAVEKVKDAFSLYEASPQFKDDLAYDTYALTIGQLINQMIPGDIIDDAYARAWDEINQILILSYKGKEYPKPAHFADAYKEYERRKAARTLGDEGEPKDEQKSREQEAINSCDIDWLAFNSTNATIRVKCQLVSDMWQENDHRIWRDNLNKPDQSVKSRIERGDLERPDRDGVVALISSQQI